ncbi:hypothetical protein BU25DRAFT_421757 [Macroventuria anomochaeta]|uniref:Uncharacterized protein n=1 Tax=Macroventuria anomochaeta TaxID=301207 RepID=A0ACB6S2G4_9PLEO|nr:uncharacterized protein BU25DRAFT_421757 [Macroventuria anomochaeta]KAF2627322.1 hypothetical protein BU25DRAFT_421757 [Macroventuria anomochaeta]
MSLVDTFIREHWNRDHFDHIANSVKGTISTALREDPPDKRILHQLSARAKDETSLRKKLQSRHKSRPFDSIDAIKGCDYVWDLAGVRVLVYFPDDILGVLEKVLAKFQDRLASDPYVRDNKREHKKLPVKDWDVVGEEDQLMALTRIRGDLSGPWRERPADQVVRDWKHYGYLAVHLHVFADDIKTQLEVEERSPVPEEVANNHEGKREEEWQEDQEQTREGDHSWKRRVEIQITTVVMHAWSEVEHDIVYKNPWNLPPDQAMDRMLDAINGLSITSEILLRQLQQSITSITSREDRNIDNSELEWILEEWYRGLSSSTDRSSPRSPLGSTSRYTPMLRAILGSPLFGKVTTRRQLRPLLQKHQDSIVSPASRLLDLSRNFLCVLGNELEGRMKPWRNEPSPPRQSENHFGVELLHKMLHITNTVSIAAALKALSGEEVKGWKLKGNLQDSFYEDNRVITNALQSFSRYREGGLRDQLREKLQQEIAEKGFEDRFLPGLHRNSEMKLSRAVYNTMPDIEFALDIISGIVHGDLRPLSDGLQVAQINTLVCAVDAHIRRQCPSLYEPALAMANMSFFIITENWATFPQLTSHHEHPMDHIDDPIRVNHKVLEDFLRKVTLMVDRRPELPGIFCTRSVETMIYCNDMEAFEQRDQEITEHESKKAEACRSDLVLRSYESRSQDWLWYSRDQWGKCSYQVADMASAVEVSHMVWVPPEVVFAYLKLRDTGVLDFYLSSKLWEGPSINLDFRDSPPETETLRMSCLEDDIIDSLMRAQDNDQEPLP